MVALTSKVLNVERLTKHYRSGANRVEALRGVDLQVTRGEFVVFMGPSGSGKSTLLHLVAGLDQPTSGRISLDGVEMADLDDDGRTLLRRRQIGVIFQSFQLMASLSAEENVALPLAIAGRPGAEARRRARSALEQVGLGHRQSHRPHELSGGEQQRVAIARALVTRPVLLLADEPTGNLDSVQGDQIVKLLRQLTDESGHTLLMVTHDPRPATLADRVINMRDGRVSEAP
jgi:putative ABC transport system ATP-binding protein